MVFGVSNSGSESSQRLLLLVDVVGSRRRSLSLSLSLSFLGLKQISKRNGNFHTESLKILPTETPKRRLRRTAQASWQLRDNRLFIHLMIHLTLPFSRSYSLSIQWQTYSGLFGLHHQLRTITLVFGSTMRCLLPQHAPTSHVFAFFILYHVKGFCRG